MKLVVGLGNPGARYRRTRHNVGFRIVDRLAERWNVVLDPSRGAAEVADARYASTRVVLAKPSTFMNASGEAVAKLRYAYGVEPADVVAVHDDLDLPLGRVRVRGGGGAGGHRGVLSLIAELGAEFARVRIGIGRPLDDGDPVAFVLAEFTPDETPRVEEIVDRAADAVESLIRDGLERTMGTFNRVPSTLAIGGIVR